LLKEINNIKDTMLKISDTPMQKFGEWIWQNHI
jgi:hypothetical protein